MNASKDNTYSPNSTSTGSSRETKKSDNSQLKHFQNPDPSFGLKYPSDCKTKKITEIENFDRGRKYSLEIICHNTNVYTMTYYSPDFTPGIKEGCCQAYTDKPLDTTQNREQLAMQLADFQPTDIKKTTLDGKQVVRLVSRKEYSEKWWEEMYILSINNSVYTNVVISSPVLQQDGESDFNPNQADLDHNNDYQIFRQIINSLNFNPNL